MKDHLGPASKYTMLVDAFEHICLLFYTHPLTIWGQ